MQRSCKTWIPATILKPSHHVPHALYVKSRAALGDAFQFWAERVVCRYPRSTLAVTCLWVTVCCIGFPQTEFTTDPVELWVDPASRSAFELNFYNEKFDPFYRSEVIIATLKPELQSGARRKSRQKFQ